MKIAVSCDEYCAKVGENFYLRDFGHILVNRYLMVFDNVRLIVRTFDRNDIESCGKFNIEVKDPRLEIYPIPFFQGPKEFLKQKIKIDSAVRSALENCDGAIFRLPSALGFSVWAKALSINLPYAVELVYDCKDGYGQAKGLSKLLWWQMHRKQVKACAKSSGFAPVTSHYLQSHYEPKNDDIIKSHYSSVEIGDNFFFQPRLYPAKDRLMLVHVANQVQFKGRKGHEDVISAIAFLKNQGIDIDVTFVGEDYFNGIAQLREYASSLGIEDRVFFTGFLSSQKMREVLLSSDIAILPTKAEGLPRVVIEAMAVGLPCIVSNVSGNPELIQKEFLFDYGDVPTIAHLIKSLVIDKNTYENTSLRNYEKSKEFSRDVLDKRRREFFSSVKQKIETNNIK